MVVQMFKKFHALVFMSALACLSFFGCSTDKTQLVVLVGSDLAVPTELAEIRVKITADDGSGKQAERSFELGEGDGARSIFRCLSVSRPAKETLAEASSLNLRP